MRPCTLDCMALAVCGEHAELLWCEFIDLACFLEAQGVFYVSYLSLYQLLPRFEEPMLWFSFMLVVCQMMFSSGGLGRHLSIVHMHLGMSSLHGHETLKHEAQRRAFALHEGVSRGVSWFVVWSVLYNAWLDIVNMHPPCGQSGRLACLGELTRNF